MRRPDERNCVPACGGSQCPQWVIEAGKDPWLNSVAVLGGSQCPQWRIEAGRTYPALSACHLSR